jgi:hypothetical protein
MGEEFTCSQCCRSGNQASPQSAVCHSCEKDAFREYMREQRQKQGDRRRKSLVNILEKNNLTRRAEFVNEGTVVIDEEFWYYSKAKKARAKGRKNFYQMRGFQHFLDVFILKKQDKTIRPNFKK